MLPDGAPPHSAVRAPGRLGQALMRLLMRRATVVATEQLADRFKLITLEGEALRDVVWSPGQKVQIAMGSAFMARTYTPLEWNAATGRTCILGFAHGEGPGSAWVDGVQPGDDCDLFGPRASLDLRRTTGPVVVIGDETSIGLAYALVRHGPSGSVSCVFEVDDVPATRQVLDQLGLPEAELFARSHGEAHLLAMEARLAILLANSASVVLTGKAGTIQRLRHTLKPRAGATTTFLAKAYWAVGKRGLD